MTIRIRNATVIGYASTLFDHDFLVNCQLHIPAELTSVVTYQSGFLLADVPRTDGEVAPDVDVISDVYLDRARNKRQLTSELYSAAKCGTPRLKDRASVKDEQLAKGHNKPEVQAVNRPEKVSDEARKRRNGRI
jgi:hypothetical protein